MKNPVLSKCAAIGGVVLVLCVVLSRINGLIEERQIRQAQAVSSIEDSLAGTQVLLGPLLQRTCTEERNVTVGEGKDRTTTIDKREFTLRTYPTNLRIDSEIKSDVRYRGLFRVNGYGGPTTVQARWDGFEDMQPKREHAGARLNCGPVSVMLAIRDVRGLRSVTAQVDGEVQPVQAGTRHAVHTTGVHVELPDNRLTPGAAPLQMVFAMDLAGTGRLSVVPTANNTTWSLSSDWPHPSFSGRFLPVERAVIETGFTARWAVSSLASTAPAAALGAGRICDGPADTGGHETAVRPPRDANCLEMLGVDLIDPVNPYVLADRATKYAVLFIVLTFAGVALAEVMSRRRVHPLQYLLVGLALTVFYLLLLSLSEHIGFGGAYGLATIACVSLLGFYASHMLPGRRAGWVFASVMVVLYGVLWTLLRLEQTALLVGSAVLFGALATVMVVTRRLDWYTLIDQWRGPVPTLPSKVVT